MAGLILIRHAMVKIDSELSAHEWQLSKNGRLQAKQFAHQLPIAPTHLYSSNEIKAQETGRIIAEAFGTSCQIAPDLHEHDRTGAPYYPSRADFETAVFTFFNQPNDLVFGQETATEALTRFRNGVAALPDIEGQTGVVTHGTVITLFICHHNPSLNAMDFWRRLTMPCAFYVDNDYRLTHTVFC
jgi:broad specificity phosphatase PhoE